MRWWHLPSNGGCWCDQNEHEEERAHRGERPGQRDGKATEWMDATIGWRRNIQPKFLLGSSSWGGQLFPKWDVYLKLALFPPLSASYSSSNVIVHGQHHSCNGFASMFIVHAAWIDGSEL